jgi:hypothetical protein
LAPTPLKPLSSSKVTKVESKASLFPFQPFFYVIKYKYATIITSKNLQVKKKNLQVKKASFD